MITTELKNCVCCSKPLRGRSDKKFCDDFCRNTFNNHQKARGNHNGFIKPINTALLKNRNVLSSLLPEGEETIIVPREKLLRMDFQFRYITDFYTTSAGKMYYYCYDHGYLQLDADSYLIVKKKEDRWAL